MKRFRRGDGVLVQVLARGAWKPAVYVRLRRSRVTVPRRHVVRLSDVGGNPRVVVPDSRIRRQVFQIAGAEIRDQVFRLAAETEPGCLLQEGNCKAGDCPQHGIFPRRAAQSAPQSLSSVLEGGNPDETVDLDFDALRAVLLRHHGASRPAVRVRVSGDGTVRLVRV